MAVKHSFEAAFICYVKDDQGRLRLVLKHLIEEMIRVRGPARLIEALACEPPGVVSHILGNAYRRPGDDAVFGIIDEFGSPTLTTNFIEISRITLL